jgi:hypothetical protein
MNINHIPVSPHNAKAWDLKAIDMDMTLHCPEQDGVLTICDNSKAKKELASISLSVLSDDRGFTARREDDAPMQAQFVRPHQSYNPDRNIFIEPVEFVPVYHDFVTERWRVEVEPDNIADPIGFNAFVWALAHHGLKKKTKLLASMHN